MEKKLVTRARERGDLTVLRIEDVEAEIVAAEADGHITPDEWAHLKSSLGLARMTFLECHNLIQAADAAEAVVEVIRRAAGTEHYRKAVVERCWTRFDELPETA